MGFLPSHLAVAIAIEIRMEHREVKLRVRGNMWGPACVGAGSFWSSLRRALLGKKHAITFPLTSVRGREKHCRIPPHHSFSGEVL